MNKSEAANSIAASSSMVYQVLMLLRRAKDAENAGEAKHRVADVLSPVKTTLVKLIDPNNEKNEGKNQHANIQLFYSNLTGATAKLKAMSTEDKIQPYILPRKVENISWCDNLLENHNPKSSEPILDIAEGSSIASNLDNDFDKLKSMPHIYLVTALMMWYDGDAHSAIRLLTSLDKDKTNANQYIKADPNISNLLYLLALTDDRPNDYLVEYTEKNLDILTQRLNDINNADKTSPDWNSLKNRFEKGIYNAKNNVAYTLIRQSKQPSFEQIEHSLKYASDAYSYPGNRDNAQVIDTLGYVQMVSALRGHWSADNDKTKQEILAARLLLRNAYAIASREYDSHYTDNDEATYFYSLKLIEEHLKEAEKYAAELDQW